VHNVLFQHALAGQFSLDFRRWLTDYKPTKIESDETARRWESELPDFLVSVNRVD
jgi:hypothetical protein